MPLGTGVAAAQLVGGRLWHGRPWAGEIGHVVVDPDGDPAVTKPADTVGVHDHAAS